MLLGVKLMPEILPRHYIFGIIIFCLVITSGIGIMGVLSKDEIANDDRYNEFVSNFDQMGSINSTLLGYKSETEQTKTEGISVLGVIGTLAQATWGSLSFMVQSLSFMDDAFNGLEMFGVPSFIPQILILIVIVIIIFTIWSAIFQMNI